MGRKLKYLFIFVGVLLILNLVYGQQAINGSRYILGYWGASQARWTKPFLVSASQPATCAVGEVKFDSDATAGQNLYLCTATDTWTQVTGGGGSGDMTKAGLARNNTSVQTRQWMRKPKRNSGSPTGNCCTGGKCHSAIDPGG